MKLLELNLRVKFLKNLYEYQDLVEEEGIIPILLIPDEKGEWYTFKPLAERLVRTLLAYYDFSFLKRIEGKNEVFHFYKDRNNFIYLVNLKEDECSIVMKELKSEVNIPIYQINFGYFEGIKFHKIPFACFLLDETLQKLNYNNLKDLITAAEIDITLPNYIL